VRRAGHRRVDPLSELGGDLLRVEKPSRYLGGESGCVRKGDDSLLTIALCFPDLYEIGMSNNAIRILYSGLNAMPGVRAERIFAPAPDFESLLAGKGLPLYTLETGIAVHDVDILGFSLGYELAATSVITVLKSGLVPVRASERGEGDPIVLVGGPAATNPHPLAAFIDAAYIGEAEAGFFDLAEELAGLKRRGIGRAEMLDRLRQVDAIWMPDRDGVGGKRARRAVFGGFSLLPAMTALPLPTLKTVQDHGTVEIMRGCPNGCRFCHAGYFYRPRRIKAYDVIRAEVQNLVDRGGYREITLASLSSGDYPGIGGLLDRLNSEWGKRRVSFQLPSLKINSFTLPIVRKLAEVRKSGLTFAVETPVDEWQRAINKDVSFEKTLAILEEARAAGFRQAKFYFMIGLPVAGRGIGEAQAILEFLSRIRSRTGFQMNVNVGTFVPKPHTPFQWSAQLGEGESLEAMNSLRSGARHLKNVKLSYHSPFLSQLEGLLARGDERVGELILAAHGKGARLDAWEEHFDRELWRSVLDEAHWPVVEECCGARETDSRLPWDDISIRVSKPALLRELERSIRQESTSACMDECANPCGACNDEVGVVDESIQGEAVGGSAAESFVPAPPAAVSGRLVLQYSKRGIASYMQHLSVVDAFDRAMLVSGIDIAYSEGFNPMPRFETAQPLPIAVESDCEIASILLCSEVDPHQAIRSINEALPEGLRIVSGEYFPVLKGKKQRTIGSLEWGSVYSICDKTLVSESSETLLAKIESVIRDLSVPELQLERKDDAGIQISLPLPRKKEHSLLRILEQCSDARPIQSAFAITRTQLIADPGDGSRISFFQAYRVL
jgi:radical SAM family uncharacterized protein/radical SAM-linked protein